MLPSANESTVVNNSTKVLRALGWGAYDQSGAQSQFLRQECCLMHCISEKIIERKQGKFIKYTCKSKILNYWEFS